jgi:hypothetical protein
MRVALLLALVAIVSACSAGPSSSASVNPGLGGISIASGPRISPPPVSPPTPPSTTLPDFACSDASGGTTGVANVTTARVAESAAGYDRFVLQLDSIVPTYTVKRQDKPVFPLGASGQTVTLSGTAGVLVTVHSATGATTFTGPSDLVHPEYKLLVEARQTQDFEGYVSWGLGLSKPACMRVFTIPAVEGISPARLVVDFQTAT